MWKKSEMFHFKHVRDYVPIIKLMEILNSNVNIFESEVLRRVQN